ncbi:hypothetical protein [Gluconobacter cerinus]|uniref:hypothetical protein n=1 Tax=Gluconobacter cerinus TaxID=38307 RepID=UPI001FFD8385|nr:hypothetical protein [Gluconobacter cerinus]
MSRRILNIVLGGTVASSGAVLVLSRIRAGSYGPGINCTAHWLHGEQAAKVEHLDIRHSLVGIATNAAAVFFWSWLYHKALGTKPTAMRAVIITALLGPVSCLVDYKATPKRFTPGWELVFSRSDMATIYFSMVVGMALGATRQSPSTKNTKSPHA